MNKDQDQMFSAIEDVNSVADELRKLRSKIKEYGDASTRMNKFGEALDGLNGSIKKIQGAFSGALEKIEKSHSQIDAGRQSVEKLFASVPDIVKSIESSDAAKTIADFSESIKELKALMDAQQKTVSDIEAMFVELKSSQAASNAQTEKALAAVSNLSSEVRGLQDSSANQTKLLSILSETISSDILGSINSQAELKEMVREVQTGNNKALDAMANFASKMNKEISALRGEIVTTKQMLTSQDKVMEEISNKKRGLFG